MGLQSPWEIAIFSQPEVKHWPSDIGGTILNAKISARIRYGNLAHVSDGCRQKHSIQNCGQKPADRDMVTRPIAATAGIFVLQDACCIHVRLQVYIE